MSDTPAAWHPDPHDPTQLRYWDGTVWTGHIAPASTPEASQSEILPLVETTVLFGDSMSPVAEPKAVLLSNATYLGGFDFEKRKHTGNLHFKDSQIGVGAFGPRHAVVRASNVASIEVGGGQIGKRKTGATLAFGVVGAMAAKGSKNEGQLAVHLRDGSVGFYQLDKKSPSEVKAAIATWMRAYGIEFHDELRHAELVQAATGQHAPTSLADELVKLAALHQSGVLSDAEFTAQKTRLLG